MVIQILDQPLWRIEAQIIVLCLYSDRRPPHGAAGFADWYLCGFISRLLRAKKISTTTKEQSLLATQGRFRSPKLLLLGMGESGRVTPSLIYSVWYEAARTLCHIHVSNLITTIPIIHGDNNVREITVQMMQGFIDGIEAEHKNIRDFTMTLTYFDKLGTKKNKDGVRNHLKSLPWVNLIGF